MGVRDHQGQWSWGHDGIALRVNSVYMEREQTPVDIADSSRPCHAVYDRGHLQRTDHYPRIVCQLATLLLLRPYDAGAARHIPVHGSVGRAVGGTDTTSHNQAKPAIYGIYRGPASMRDS